VCPFKDPRFFSKLFSQKFFCAKNIFFSIFFFTEEFSHFLGTQNSKNIFCQIPFFFLKIYFFRKKYFLKKWLSSSRKKQFRRKKKSISRKNFEKKIFCIFGSIDPPPPPSWKQGMVLSTRDREGGGSQLLGYFEWLHFHWSINKVLPFNGGLHAIIFSTPATFAVPI
jgi:hypothetical protein